MSQIGFREQDAPALPITMPEGHDFRVVLEVTAQDDISLWTVKFAVRTHEDDETAAIQLETPTGITTDNAAKQIHFTITAAAAAALSHQTHYQYGVLAQRPDSSPFLLLRGPFTIERWIVR